MPKRYNTPHRSRVVKTRLSEDEYADFTARLAPYGISQSEFLRQTIRRATIRPVVHVSAVNDELLSAIGKLTAEYGSIVDISQLQLMLNKAVSYRYKNAGFILDRGYFSRENIRYMDHLGYDFVITVKGMKSFVNDKIREVQGSFEEKRQYTIRQYQV